MTDSFFSQINKFWHGAGVGAFLPRVQMRFRARARVRACARACVLRNLGVETNAGRTS